MPPAELAEPKRLRPAQAVVGAVFLIAASALAALAIWNRHTALATGLKRIAPGSIVVSVICAVCSVAATLLAWRAVLTGFGVRLELLPAARVYFVGQLGKYIPGSVWPVLAQMELGRRHNVGRKTMLTGATLSIIVSVAVGTALACALLPFTSPAAFHRYWWLLACLPIIVIGLHPRVLLTVVNRALRLIRRDPMSERVTVRAEIHAAAWYLVSWVLLGCHVYLLISGLGVSGPKAFADATAAGCLAVSVGILLIPVPAGAGVREVAFVLSLAPVLNSSDGLLVALISRVALIVADLVLAAAAAVLARRAPPPRRPPVHQQPNR